MMTIQLALQLVETQQTIDCVLVRLVPGFIVLPQTFFARLCLIISSVTQVLDQCEAQQFTALQLLRRRLQCECVELRCHWRRRNLLQQLERRFKLWLARSELAVRLIQRRRARQRRKCDALLQICHVERKLHDGLCQTATSMVIAKLLSQRAALAVVTVVLVFVHTVIAKHAKRRNEQAKEKEKEQQAPKIQLDDTYVDEDSRTNVTSKKRVISKASWKADLVAKPANMSKKKT